MALSKEVLERTRKVIPEGNYIVEKSTPVLSFGNPLTSTVATLGINPSSGEFLYGKDQPLLKGKEKRLVDFETLNISKPRELTDEESELVVEGCNNYFKTGNHYKWFLKAEEHILKPAGFTYFSDQASACHLDLVQWATDPVWSGIKEPAIRRNLLKEDKEFLRFQLTNYKFKYVFLNGGTVLKQFDKLKIANLKAVHQVTRNSSGGIHEVYRGEANGTIFLGWGINATSDDANKTGLVELKAWIKQELTN
jgi:hypothetical protein